MWLQSRQHSAADVRENCVIAEKHTTLMMCCMTPAVCDCVQYLITVNSSIFTQDSEQWDSLYNALGSRCYTIAGSASKSISRLLQEGNISTPKSSGLVIKHTNQTTMCDLVEITNLIDSE